MRTISILGCGWLGLPLAKSLLSLGHTVKGSTTTKPKISTLEDAGISGFFLEISEKQIDGDVEDFLEDSDILIINIPPKLRGSHSENYVSKIQNLIPFIEKSSINQVLFISSTSVYQDIPKDPAIRRFSTLTEETIPNPQTESGKQLLETEILLQNNPNFSTTVVRFGGLIGEDRHPIYSLAGRDHVENAEAPINLIDQSDCIGIISAIILQEKWGVIWNAVAPFHPSRKSYYKMKALNLDLPEPKFEEKKESLGKLISSEKIRTELKYTFQNLEL